MARTNNLTDFLSDVADAIRTKKGTSETILASDFDTEIENLPSGGGDLDEYFVTEITKNTSSSQHIQYPRNVIKKYPDIMVANNVTSLTYALSQFSEKIMPRLVFGNNVTNISSLFYSITSASTFDVSGFDTSNVTSMNSLFRSCTSLTDIDLSNFKTEKVETIAYMFEGCSSLPSVNLSSFNTSNVTNMQGLFGGCGKLTSLDLSNFETPKNKNVVGMFNNCVLLSHIDMRKFDFLKANNYSDTTFGATASNGVPDDCEIIVADDTQKTWITSKFSRLTNVKTVAEYEAEQNA